MEYWFLPFSIEEENKESFAALPLVEYTDDCCDIYKELRFSLFTLDGAG